MPYVIPPDRPNRDGLPPGPVPIELALERPDSQLYYPRSRILQQYLNDELASEPIYEFNRGTYLRTFLTADASEADLIEWYVRELTTRRWAAVSRNAQGTMLVFIRGDTEEYIVVIRREGGFGRPSNAPRGRLVYEGMYAIVGGGRAGLGS